MDEKAVIMSRPVGFTWKRLLAEARLRDLLEEKPMSPVRHSCSKLPLEACVPTHPKCPVDPHAECRLQLGQDCRLKPFQIGACLALH